MNLKERKEKAEKERLKKPLKTSVHPTRIIAYLVQVGICYYAYDFLRNHFLMIVLTILIVAPVFDFVGLFFTYKGVQVELLAPEKNVTRFSLGYLTLRLINSSILFSFDTCVKLDAENTFYNDMNGAIISLPLSGRNTYEKYIPIKYSMNGIYKYHIGTITIRDILGFVSVRKKTDVSTEVHVYPEGNVMLEMDMNDMSRGYTESEESVKKGHDFSDVSDIREYIPGDKLMSIHWKLSAKRDILMVKDRVSMSDQQMVILTELAGEDECVDEVLTLTYGIVDRFVRGQTFVKLMWWSEGRFAFEERQIMNLDDLREAFSDIYYDSIYQDAEKTKGYMRSIRPELKAYVNICMHNGSPDAVIVEQD